MENIVELFKKVLAKGVQIKASDVHLCVGSPWKYRLHGHITPINIKPLEMSECEAIVRHILMSTQVIDEENVDQGLKRLKDLDCAYSIPGVSRFRVNICRQRGSFSVVLRVVPFVVPTIDSLGLPKVIEDISMEERGMILVTGVTGSGKSTTLASMINRINEMKPKSSIIQREVGPDTDDFGIALRGALRQDPDVILVGEMRDTTTIETALKAAETGHLVLSTLHTMDAPKTIQRIISAFELSEQQAIRIRLAESVKAIISQRLLRRKDNSERVAVLEVMRNTLTIKDCIENPEKTGSIKDYMAAGKDQYGMQTFDQHLMDLYTDGVIDIETAKSAATSSADFERNVTFG